MTRRDVLKVVFSSTMYLAARRVFPASLATIDPRVVQIIVHLCFQAMASKVDVFDRSTTSTPPACVTSGIAKAGVGRLSGYSVQTARP